MNIINNTNISIFVDDNKIEPGDNINIHEYIFDTINIHSNIGSGEIICEYNNRYIHCYGNIDIKEASDTEDKFSIVETSVSINR